MYGATIGELNVYTRTFANGSLGKAIWKAHHDQGSRWQRAAIDLSSSKPFEVVVEGFVGDDYRGDIALDDFSFTKGCTTYHGKLPTVKPSTDTTLKPTTIPHSCSPLQFHCYLTGNLCCRISAYNLCRDLEYL